MAAPIGNMVMNLMNPNADANLAAAITPNPNPLAQQGQPAPATSGSSTMPNAAATKQDPVSANLAYLLLDRQRKAAAAQGLEQGLGEISAGFGTAQQQASKQAALHGGGGAGGGGIGDVSDIMGIQKQVQDQNEYARFHANVGVFAQALRDHGINVTDDQARVLMDSKPFVDSMGTAFGGNVTQTATGKDFNTARTAAAADIKAIHPDWTPEQVQAEVMKQVPASILGTSIGGQTPEEAQYNQYVAAERAAGRIPDQFNIWKGKQASEVKSITDINQTNLDAKQSWPSVKAVWDEHTATIDWLHDPTHLKAVTAAIQRPDMLTEGNQGNLAKMFGITSQDIEDAKGFLNQYRNQLTADKFVGSKNVRSNFEAKFLGGSASHLFEKTNSPAVIKGEINRLWDETHTRAVNAAAAAGQEVPLAYELKVDPSLIDPNNSLYNGAKVAGSEPSPSDVSEAKAELAAHPEHKADIIEYFHSRGMRAGKVFQ